MSSRGVGARGLGGRVAKKSHFSLCLTRKVELLRKMEAGVPRKTLMEEYGISSSTVYDIKKQKDDIFKYVAQGLSGESNRRKMRKPKLAELDAVLYKWYREIRALGKPVTGISIVDKAKAFYADMQISEPCVFSDGWLRNFKLRHGIRQLDVSGESESADVEAAERYSTTFSALVREHELQPSQMYNADETGLFFKSIPERTLAGAGEKAAKGFKRNKERLTVLVCANASGTHKVKLLVIGKFKNPRALKNVQHLPVWYDAQGNAWMTAVCFSDWFHHYFVPCVKANLQKEGLPLDSKVVLLLDNCRAHPPASELVNGNIFVVYLPPNVTSIIQPMDQGVIQKFKTSYRASFTRDLLSSPLSVPDFQRNFNIKDAIFMAALAWQDVKPTTLQRCWRKLWPGAMFQDTEEDEEEFLGFGDQRSGDYRKIVSLVKAAPQTSVLSELSEDDVAEWVAKDSDAPVIEEVTDQDLIRSITHPEAVPEPQNESSDEDEGEDDRAKVTWKEAASAYDTLLRFVECSHHFNSAEVMQYHVQYRDFQTKRAASVKQASLFDLFKKAAKKASGAAVTPSPDATPPEPVASTSSIVNVTIPVMESLDLEEVDVDDPLELESLGGTAGPSESEEPFQL